MSEKQSFNPYIIPGAIVVAGLLIAGAVFLGGGGSNSSSDSPGTDSGAETSSIENLRPVTEDEHILGDINAPVKIVEFSDLECPFCKRFHTTMKQVMAEYGADGRVAWVYRHFPLTSLHPKVAIPAAIASECAAELGGNFTFWAFVDRYFEVTPSNDQMDLSLIPQIAVDVGIDRAQFNSCFAEGEARYQDKIQSQYQDAIDSGGQGTPFSVVIASDGTKIPVSGAVPFQQLKQIIDQAL